MCKCALKLLFKSDSTNVVMFKSNHEHTNHNKKISGIGPVMAEKILNLYELGVTKPSSIKMTLRSQNIEDDMPTRRQLY